jgi:TonB family protein
MISVSLRRLRCRDRRHSVSLAKRKMKCATCLACFAALMAQFALVPVASAQTHKFTGDIWTEADSGRIVYASGATVYLWPAFRIGGENSAALGSTRLGPLEYHSSQFCTDPEARVGAAASMNDTPLTPADRIYQSSELDRNVTVIYSGDRTQYPESMRKAGIPGEVVLSFVVDAKGNAEIDGVRVVRFSAPDFVEPAKRALATMRFAPGEANGKPVRSRVSETFSVSIQP